VAAEEEMAAITAINQYSTRIRRHFIIQVKGTNS